MSKKINSISITKFITPLILLTYIINIPIQSATGRGQAIPVISELHGGIGMGTWDTKAEFRDILVQTGDGKTLLQSYFTNNLDGWQRGGGEWTSVSGVLNQNSRDINCQIICGENTWTDYTYSLKARRTEGTEGFLIIFSAQDSKNLYWWNIGGWGNTRTAIEKMTKGGKREIPGTAVDLRIETGTWYDIKITISGDTASCYFNGNLITKIIQDKGSSTLPDAGPPNVVNNGNGPESVRSSSGLSTGLSSGSRSLPVRSGGPVPTPEDVINKVLIPASPVQSIEEGNNTVPVLRTTTPVIIPDISPTPKLDNPSSWVPIANGCQIQQTGSKIQITGTNNIDGWGHGNGVISTSAVPTGDFYATVNFIVRKFSGPGNARVYFRAVSTKNNGKMAAVVYDPQTDTFQIQGWGVNGEPDTVTQPVQKAGNNMMYRWLTLQYDSKNKTISSTATSNRYLGTIDYDLSDPVRFELLTDADTKGMQIDVEFNNFSVTTDRIPATPDRITGGIPEQSTTKIWKSPNGKYAVKMLENLVVTGHGDGARGPIIFRRRMTYVTGLAVDSNGTTSKQWEWTEPQPPRDISSQYSSYITLQVADVLVGDSGNRFALLGRFNNINSTPPRAFQRVIVILDDKGKTHTEVIADDWLKVLGADGEITSDKPPKLSFLENEKILEIKLASGKTVHVNTDSGELSIKNGEDDTGVQVNPVTPELKIDEQTLVEANNRSGIKPVEHKELLDILEQELKVSDRTANQELVNKFSQYPKEQKLETAAYCLKENKYAGLVLWQMGRDNQLRDERLVPYIIEVMPKLQGRDLMYAASAAYRIPDVNFVEPLLEYVIKSDYKTEQVVGNQMMHYSAYESAAIALRRITGGELGNIDIKKSRQVQIQEWRDAWSKVRQDLQKEIHPAAHQELLDIFAKAENTGNTSKRIELDQMFRNYKLNDKLETVVYVMENGLYPNAFFALCQVQDKRLLPFIARALQDSNGVKVLLATQLAYYMPDPSLLPLLMKYGLENNFGRDYKYSVGQNGFGAGERNYVSYHSVFGFTAAAIYKITDGKIGSQSYINIKQEIPETERKDLIEKWRKIYDETLKKDYEK